MLVSSSGGRGGLCRGTYVFPTNKTDRAIYLKYLGKYKRWYYNLVCTGARKQRV
jgi:hypothetical protein